MELFLSFNVWPVGKVEKHTLQQSHTTYVSHVLQQITIGGGGGGER